MSIIRKMKKDTRGAALVYVIVASAIIALLGAATVTAAYSNLRATQIQEKSDNNFYSADTVMNAIVGGIENDVSRAYEAAYTNVITSLNTYSNMEDARKDFGTAFLNSLDSILNDGAESFKFYYSIEHIKGYVESVYIDDIRYTISAVNGNNYLDVTEDGVILRNLHVTYEDDSGYYDEITTDIKIAIPDFDPEAIQKPNLLLNAFIVDDGLELVFNSGLQINGDAYINERESDHNAILLKDKSSLTVITPNEIVAGGLIKTNENTSFVIKGTSDQNDGNLIWTENFDFGRYTDAYISGQIYVYDDLEINGSYSNVRLAGEYYGYSQSNKYADESSAININGAHTKLDIQKLDMLVLAGSSYINTSENPSGNDKYENSSDLQLGESLSVKSNQIAYLVDDKEFSTSDINDFVSNPMSYAQYEKLIVSNGGLENTIKKITSKKLSYGKSYAEYGASVVPIFSNKDNGTVYLYLSFNNADDASTFFVDAYKGNTLLSQRLRTYAAQYITSIKINTNSELLVNQNYIDSSVALYTEESIPTSLPGLGYDQSKPNGSAMENILQQIKTDYLDNGEVDGAGIKYKVIYSKLVNNEKLKEFIENATAANSYTDHHTNNEITIVDNGVILRGTNGAQAVIVDNAGKEIYELGDGKGLVVVSGDLKITGDWLGTIIVGGRAYCEEGTKDAPLDITIDNTIVSSVLPLYFSIKNGSTTKSMSVMNIFKGYENLGVNTATSESGINAANIANCITYTNWVKH